MAIAISHINLLLELRKQGVLTGANSRSILEFGEQNWFGDVDPTEIHQVIDMFHDGSDRAEELHQQLNGLLSQGHSEIMFDLAKLFYRAVLEYERYQAIDLHGTKLALSHDLNVPLAHSLGQFDVVTNIGTSEHVFNQYQFFKTLHEATRPGGLMIHALPNQGCYDHGFFNYHPTFFFDLAEANQYRCLAIIYVDASQSPPQLVNITRVEYVRLAVAGKLSHYSGLFAVFAKLPVEQPFQVPQQGYYNNALPEELAQAWSALPR